MTREPLAESGFKNTGTWKLNATGFCTTWQHARPSCFTVIPKGENKWLEHFSLMLTRSLRVGGNWRILPDKLCVGANEFCARGSVSFAQPLFAAVL